MKPAGSLAPEESYTERRKLFRNIWETAVTIEEKETKPRLIRTLKLGSDEKLRKSAARKKEKLKNLRHVCNKILDFCDKQEAEEFIFEDKIIGELGAEENDMKKVRRSRKNKKQRTLYNQIKSSKIKYKHPPRPLLSLGDYRSSRKPSPDKLLSSSPKLLSRKDLKSDYQFTPIINDLRQTSTIVNRKNKIRRRKKVIKNKNC